MSAFADALGRLLRPDRHLLLRLLDEQPVTVDDVLRVPRLEAACEALPGCCPEWSQV